MPAPQIQSPRQKRHVVARIPQREQGAFSGGISEDIKALNSSILIISQKMKYVVRNEKILGRNLVVLNKKLRNLEDKVESGSGSAVSAEKLAEMVELLRKMGERLAIIDAELSEIRDTYAQKEQLQELKYVIDSINPLEFVTLKQVNELIDQKIGKKGK